MPPSLRKACQACTKSKRRCVPQLPACQRCAKKQITCIYDLEPVVQTQPSPQAREDTRSNGSIPQLNIVYNSVETARNASIAALATGQGVNSAAARPMLMTDGDNVRWLVTFFSNVARDGLDGRSSPFVHSSIIRHGLSTSQEMFGVTDESANERKNLKDRLFEIYGLTTQSLSRLLLEKPSNKKDLEAKDLVTRLFSTSQSLWQAAPTNLHDNFDPWEAWLVAESIRRSMFAAVLVRGLWHFAASGYCYYEPFFESMPFDPRAGAWEAENAEQWQKVIRRYGGEHTKLKSYNEFITTTGSKLHPEEDGEFQRMLFIAYNGSSGIKALEELDKCTND